MIEPTQPQGFLTWLKESVTLKLMFIGILILVLLIPSAMIQDLIFERAGRQDEVNKEISDTWSGSQLMQGPVLVIPYKKLIKTKDIDNKETVKETIARVYILPNELQMKAAVTSQILHRGIFESVVYNTRVKISGDFKPQLAALNITPEQLLTEKATLTFKISDLKGLKTNPVVLSGSQKALAEPVFNDAGLFPNGLKAAITVGAQAEQTIPFEVTLDLKGSQDLNFLHTGKTTDVAVTGDWQTPSFSGRYLPDERKVDTAGFAAKWRMLYFNRPFAQQWAGNDILLNAMAKQQDAIFGVTLKLPVDQYQKVTRTAKYSVLVILLTFVSLFLTEMIRKQRIHSFNYVLIGAAMVIYYTLLLSFSEQLGYNIAYLIASVATITLVSVFVASLLKSKGAAIMFCIILAIFYAFIYVIIQLEDLALLIGSIALFVIISLLMYFSRRINWDKH